MAKESSNGHGIASMVLGIVSIVLCWVPLLGLASGIVAIVMYVKQKRIAKNGMATAGLVTGIIGTAFSTIYLIMWLMIGVILGGVSRGLGGLL